MVGSVGTRYAAGVHNQLPTGRTGRSPLHDNKGKHTGSPLLWGYGIGGAGLPGGVGIDDASLQGS